MFNSPIILEPSLVREGVNLIRPYYNQLKPDVSSYAKGRLRVWLQAEAPLSDSQDFKPGIKDEKLWQWVKDACKKAALPGFENWEPDVALVTWSGVGEEGVGISEHRDAGYADFPAITINLLGTCEFSIRPEHSDFKYSPIKGFGNIEPIKINLDPGSVVGFNCKCRHAAKPSPKRLAISAWRISKKWREQWEQFRNGVQTTKSLF